MDTPQLLNSGPTRPSVTACPHILIGTLPLEPHPTTTYSTTLFPLSSALEPHNRHYPHGQFTSRQLVSVQPNQTRICSNHVFAENFRRGPVAMDGTLNGASSAPRILVLGYNGANNTGAEALLQADLADLRSLLPHATITVPTLNQTNLRRYISEDDHLHIVPIPTLYFHALDRLVRRHDVLILVEGSTYMDTWGSALLWAFLWATSRARRYRKPCLAYAVDAGELRPVNRRLLKRISCQPNMVITRNQAAAKRLRSWGVQAPMRTTADNAFNYLTQQEDQDWLQNAWPEAENGIVGLAVVDFSLWPVVMRPWGRRERCYRWPYYFSTSAERSRLSARLAEGFAALADEIAEKQGKPVALICMEQVDEPLARQIQSGMKHPEMARICSSRTYNASQMTVLLRSLHYLITSRYHAAVLSLAAQVPQIAVGHDRRLHDLYSEMDLVADYFVAPNLQSMFPEIRVCIDKLLANQVQVDAKLKRGYEMHLARARQNRSLLSAFLASQGWSVQA